MTETNPAGEPAGDSDQQDDREFDPAEIEDDPAYDPDEDELKEMKGG